MLSSLIKKSAFLDTHQLHSAFFTPGSPDICTHAASWHVSYLIRSEPPARPLTLTSFYTHNRFWSAAAKSLGADSCSCLALTSSPAQLGRGINTTTWLRCDTGSVDGKFLWQRGACPVTVTELIIILATSVLVVPVVSGQRGLSRGVGCLWRRPKGNPHEVQK